MVPGRADSGAGPVENDPVTGDASGGEDRTKEGRPKEDRPKEDLPKEDRPKEGGTEEGRKENWAFPFHEAFNAVAPALLRSQNAWLSQIDSLSAPDRKTHELIRMVCSVVARNPQGIRRHAMLAAEVGATWEEVAGSVILAEPAFGILVAVEAFPWARKGWERGSSLGDEEEPG
jgi:hypothetical protein